MHIVITGVRSVTHLVHIASYLRHVLTRRADDVTVAYVGGGTFLGRAAVSEADVRRLLPDHPRLHLTFPAGASCWALPADDVVYVAVGSPGLKPWAMMRKANPRKRIRVVVTDEGISSYGDWRTRRDAWSRQGVPEPWRSVRTVAVTAGAARLTSERWPLYRRTGSGWQVHEPVAAEFRRHTATVRPAGDERTVVLVTQPWVDLDLLTESAYLRHVAQIAAAVDRAGRRLVLRPHPAEPRERYVDFDLLPGHGPAELDPDVVRAGAVVGSSSTAVLNLAALFGLRAVRLHAPGLDYLEGELSPAQRELLHTYTGSIATPDQLPARLRLGSVR